MQAKPGMNNRIRRLRADRIRLPEVPRRALTDEGELARLADSIAAVGVIQPLLVVREGLHFSLVCGARRLQAAKMAGLRRVPCVVLWGRAAQKELWALAGDTGAEELSCFDLANSIARARAAGSGEALLLAVTGLCKEELETALGLLRLSDAQQLAAAAAGMRQRQAAPLAALPEEQRARIFAGITDSGLSLQQQAEALRARLHIETETPRRRTGAVKDMRIFFNTLERAVEMMRQAGVQAQTQRLDGEDYAEFRVRIPAAAVTTSNG